MKIKQKNLTNFLLVLGDNPTTRILDFLIENKRDSWNLIEIRDNAKIGYSTLKIIVPQMEKLGLLKITKKIGKSNLYTINEEDPIIKKILELKNVVLKESQRFIYNY